MRKLALIVAAILLCGSPVYASSKVFSQYLNSTFTPTIDGYSTHPPSSDPSLSTYYSLCLIAGCKWQRTDLPWDSVQSTSSSSYVWGGFDNIVNEATTDGISTIFIIDQTPTWAAYAGCSSGAGKCAPVNATTLATYCTAAATHFNGKVSYWEIWNEQNNNGNWGPSATSSDYVTDLNACGAAIKAVEPSATIITGGLSYSGNISVTQSVTDYINDGANFDMLGLHPYTVSGYPNDAGANGWGVKVDAVRAQLNAAGDSSKKLAITEFGAPTCNSGSMTNAQMQTMATQAIATSTSAYMNAFQPFFWYTVQDASTDCSTNQNSFGVFTSQGYTKSVFFTLRSN